MKFSRFPHFAESTVDALAADHKARPKYDVAGQSNDGTEPDDFGTLRRSWMHGLLIEKTDSKFFTASVVPCIEAQQPQGLHLAAKFSVPIG